MTARVFVVDDDQAWDELNELLGARTTLRRLSAAAGGAQTAELLRAVDLALPEVEIVVVGSTPDPVLGVVELRELSMRERQVLGLIAEGMTNREIAEKLFLAEKTVKNYVSRLLGKLGMSRRTQAAVYLAGLRQN
jgi:DNA-binding NarL/FixJ family response regulator